MKLTSLILSLVLSSLCLTANGAIEAAKETLYSIQLGASSQPDMKRYQKVKSYGYLYTVDAQNGMLRVMLGTFTSKSKANKTLAKVKSRGFKDAFISGGFLPETKVYTVQFASYLYTDKINWNKLQEVGIAQVDAADGRVKVVSGTFSEKSTADDYKKSLQSMGYRDAFVRQVNEGRLLNIGTNYSTTIVASSSTSSSSVSTTINSGMDMENLPIYAKLSTYERDNIVMLDGRYHMKMDERTFIPLTDYTPGTLGGTIISTTPIAPPRSYSGGTIISSTPVVSSPTIIQSSPTVVTSSPTVITSSPTVVSNTDYRIQLAAVRNYDPNQFSSVLSLGSVRLEETGTGVNRVMMGNYGSLGEAQTALSAAKAKGFPGAYVLQYNSGIRGGKVN